MNYEIIDYSEKAIVLVGDTKVIREELKSLGGKFNPRLSCGAGWIFSKSKRKSLAALINGESIPAAGKNPETPRKPKGIDPELKAELVAYYEKVWKEDFHMVDFCVKEIAHATRLSNGLIMTIEKPKIETSFCFGESGYDYDDAVHMAYTVALTEKYFKEANMKKLEETIEGLKKCKKIDECGHRSCYAYMRVHSYYGCQDRVCCEVYASDNDPEWLKSYAHDRSWELLPDEDIDTAIALFEEARDAFKKRVDAYWKRYGSSKLKTWTYWRDE